MASHAQPAFPPLSLLSLVTFFVVLAVVCVTGLSIQGPWLGLTVEPAGDRGLAVVSVHPEGPLTGELSPGEHLVAVTAPDSGQALSLRTYDPAFNPHSQSRYQGYNDYMQYQGKIASALQHDAVNLELSDGSTVTVNALSSRPISSLPVAFWLLNLFGAMACLVSLSVWMFRPGHWPARLLALSGSGFFFATLLHSVWEARELALPRATFELLMRGNHIGLHLLLVSLLVLMVIYPRRLPTAKWLVPGLLLLTVAQQLNENLQLWNLPQHTFYLPLAFYYLAGVTAAVIQWRLARYHPLDRGALRWLFLSILMAMGGGMLVYFLPALLGYAPLSDLTTMVGIASTLYIGFALGILRYRLFQIERWWFIAWAWFLGGFLVLLVDLLVVSFLGVNQGYALTFSVLAVCWLYLPFRQWLWRRLLPSSEVYMEQYLPGFVEALFTSLPGKEAEHWRSMLVTVFQPLALETGEKPVARTELVSNGARLLVPSLNDDAPALSLLYGQHGRRLFTERDRKLAEALSAVASRVCNLRAARMAGADQERKRIMRDLHDDVGGRLLTLMHTATEERYVNLARGALSALRETIYALDERRRYNLQDMLDEFRLELEERATAAGLNVVWRGVPPAGSISLPPRYFINLRRVLSEAVSNAVVHGGSGQLDVYFSVNAHQIEFQLENVLRCDTSENSDRFRGRGLNNMYTRIAELEGELSLFCRVGEAPRFCLHAVVPIPTDKEL
ncbi:sensor histidine kinase [Saccharospirillum impatiens]|uniref:sensor histidine kinase n=1 Tax=Saccharospirillum impatiens TaxID=169438 RepID=UPI00048E92CD|nr:histidine kinase [Saccharospirillum impatiens]